MKLYAFTDGKETVKVSLPFETIAQAEIDPWRLDLWEADPVTLSVEQRQLHFRRLNDLAFLYVDDSGAVIVGLHQDAKPICIRAELTHAYKGIVKCDRFAVSEHPFAVHYAEYLARFCQGRAPEPRTAEAVNIAGGTLEFDHGRGRFARFRSLPVNFLGGMFKPQPFGVALPKAVNAAFTLFADWQPIVHGKTIWRALNGQKVEQVLVSVDGGLYNVRQKYRRAQYNDVHPGQLDYKRRNITYCVRPRNMDMVSPFVDHDCSAFSVDCLHSPRENEVIGSLLAWSDVSERVTRPLIKTVVEANDRERFESEGFIILDSSRIEYAPELLDTGLPESWNVLGVRVGTPGYMKDIVVTRNSTVADAITAAGLNPTDFDISISGHRVSDLNEQLIEDGKSVMLLSRVRGN